MLKYRQKKKLEVEKQREGLTWAQVALLSLVSIPLLPFDLLNHNPAL